MTIPSPPTGLFDPADPGVALRLRRLFETDLLGIFFFGYDGSIPAANDSFLRSVGYTRDDLEAGRIDWGKMTPPEYAAQDAEKVVEVRRTGRCRPFEKVYLKPDGTPVPVLVGAAGVDEAGGVAFILDLSDRKQLERERDELEIARQQALDAAELGVCRVDLGSGMLVRDERAVAFAGAPDGARKIPVEDAFAQVHPDDLPDLRAAFDRAASGGERFDRQFRLIGEDGVTRELHAVGRPEYPPHRADGPAGADASSPPVALTFVLRDVTARAAAVRRAALLAEVIENANDLIGISTAAGTAEFMNRAGLRMLDRPEPAAEGLPISVFHSPASYELVKTVGLPTARERGRWFGETELARADGGTIPVSQNISAHRDARGTLTHFSTICRNISEQVRTREVTAARRDSLSKLAAGEPLTEALDVLARAAESHLPTPNMVCVLLREGADRGLLPAPSPTGGAGPGERLRLFAAPSLPESFREGIDGIPADESGGACGAAALRNDRVVVEDLATDPLCAPFRDFTAAHDLRAVWSSVVRAADGTALGTFAVYHDHGRVPNERDFAVVDPLIQTAAVVVERAAADARAARLTEDLKRSETRFRGTFENVGVGVAHVGMNGAWLRVNRRLCEIVGYPEEELRALTFQDITHPDDISSDLERFGSLLKGEIPSYSMRKRYFRKSGAVIWIRLTVALQRDAAGNAEYAISVVDDISDKVRAEEELLELNATLELKVASRTNRVRKQKARLERLAKGLADAEARERRRLAHVVHDDLQQVLAAAKMSVSGALAAERKSGPGPIAATVELLDEAMDRARNLTQELVPTVLYDRGLVPALAALCRQSEERFQHAVAFTDLEGDGAPSSELLDRSDPAGPLLFQAARELLYNAAKHAPRRPVRLALGLTDNRSVRLVVTNPVPHDAGRSDDSPESTSPDGTSPPDDASSPDETSNDGFGLFSLREQVVLRGGRLSSKLASDQFRVVLTLPPRSTPRTDPMAAVIPPQNLRIMIVDDHRIVRTALAGLLAGTEGIEVVGEAADGVEAVEMVEDLHPDAVVMDVTMPRMDGIEATRRVRALLPSVRVIGLSMHARDDMAEAMCEAGAAAYVPKGGPPDELIRVLLGKASPDEC